MTKERVNRKFEPRDQSFRVKVEESFALQQAMHTLGCKIVDFEPGRIELKFPYSEKLTQQHGFIHAGMLATAMDSACGFAAFSLMPENAGVLAVEFKINLLAPAKGDLFRIIGEVIKPGRTITVCQADAFAHNDGQSKLIAQMTGTIMAVYNREGIDS